MEGVLGSASNMHRMEKNCREHEGLTRRLQAFPNAVEGHGLVLGDSHFSVDSRHTQYERRCVALFLDIQIQLEDPLIPWQVLPSSHLWRGRISRLAIAIPGNTNANLTVIRSDSESQTLLE